MKSITGSHNYIDPTAIIDQDAHIGEGTSVWHFTHVMKAQIGQSCVLGQNVFVGRDVVIGNRCHIQNNVSIYSGVTLEDDVFIGPSAVFTNILTPRAEVNRKSKYVPTVVRRGATIGANATIVCGAEIGTYAFVGAGAVVIAERVPPHTLMLGVPARAKGWVCFCGVPLLHKGSTKFICPDCKALYRVDEQGALEAIQ